MQRAVKIFPGFPLPCGQLAMAQPSGSPCLGSHGTTSLWDRAWLKAVERSGRVASSFRCKSTCGRRGVEPGEAGWGGVGVSSLPPPLSSSPPLWSPSSLSALSSASSAPSSWPGRAGRRLRGCPEPPRGRLACGRRLPLASAGVQCPATWPARPHVKQASLT